MCGRFVQYEGMAIYIEELSPQIELFSGYDAEPINRFNVAPTTRVQVLHSNEDGMHIDAVRWGWAPFWAKGKRPDPINARVETVTTGKFFKQLWPTGRAIVPSEGWYEWVKDPDNPKKKQPYFIRLKSRRPMFFGALAEVHTSIEPREGDGFVIITAASDQGMVDIHDRRPLVLTSQHANEWLDPGVSAKRAEEIAKDLCKPTEAFEWIPVDRAVGNVKNQGPGLIEPNCSVVSHDQDPC
ncbi:SOS response-associated peptidase family protein [Pseudomonas marginalis]|uniref:SOS response-associated peptidase family protein n=1 Tax=Pseudomonas marginalis TaxID=298 RepID=UPI0024813D13|nr:SOS response-associated peptidase family protein [Pseudomonas marginalis]WGT30140.1 SOS response-associated peptidase family protein [Pseudomonas marginalis]